MSGIELLGAVVATSQLFGYLLDLANALLELRDHLNHSSARIQAYRQRLESLARTIQYIQANPPLLTHVVEALLQLISERVNTLNNILRKSFSRAPRRAWQRFMRVYAEKTAERRIKESLANLESYKVDLAICISGTRQMTTEHVNAGRMGEDGGILLETTLPLNELVPYEKPTTPRSDSFGSTSSTETADASTVDKEKECTGDAQAKLDEYNDNKFYDTPYGIIANLGQVDSKGPLRISRNEIRGGTVAFVGKACPEATREIFKAPRTPPSSLQRNEPKGSG